MDFELEAGWQVHSAGGDTGSAFVGIRASEKIFLKRNPSPFLAALSVEGISPRLIWTKRISSGDILTAQEWLNGRTLTRVEMQHKAVAQLLQRVHHSVLLKRMLQKVGGQFYTPDQLLEQYFYVLPQDLRAHPLLEQAGLNLKANLPQLPLSQFEVCHGDLNHKNWLLSDSKRLYLVDWDQAMLADPALDLSTILFQYVDPADWNSWLQNYGVKPDADLLARINWYGVLNILFNVKRHYQQRRFTQMNQDILMLGRFFTA